ncbi:ABC transporter substrate-binding protein [Arthrobacter sp. D2-10]
MKRTTRRATALTAAFLTVGMLAGCGGSGGGADSAEEVTELNIPAAETPWLASYQQIAADYEAETGVKINLTTFPFEGLLTQQANAAQSGSGAFDLFQLNEQWVGQFYDNEWVQPLTDVDPDFQWDENLIEFDGVGRWDAEARTTSVEGTPYSLPINGNIHLFMYRNDLYEQLGLEVPTTWDQVIENGETAINEGAVDNGYVLRGKTPSYDFSALLFSYGGKWFQDELAGDWTPALDTPEAEEALTKFKELAELGPDAPQTVAQAEATSLMQGGSVLQSTLVAAVSAPLEDEGASRVAGNIGYAPLPGDTPVSGTWTLGIPAGLEPARAEAAYDFLTWLTSKEAMDKWAEYGGVTTRTDVESDRPELQAIVESADSIRGGLRYTFTPQMLEVTEPIIGEVVAGTKTVEEGLAEMQTGLQRVVEEAGYTE